TEKWLKPADEIIARVARENGGVYDPAQHQRDLENIRGSRPAEAAPSPADLVTGNVRRLERLAAYGLASPLPDGRWRVPSDLLAQLESRERTHPWRLPNDSGLPSWTTRTDSVGSWSRRRRDRPGPNTSRSSTIGTASSPWFPN